MLKEKPRKFVEFVVRGCGIAEAAVKAGYSKKGADVQANRLMKQKEVRDAIDQAYAEIRKETKWTKERLIKGIEEIIASALKPYGESRPNESAALKGHEMITKYLKLEDQTDQNAEPKRITFEIVIPKGETA
ncbi:MAG: terminase small subunit [Fibromonadales bacterium]|nr:terminase small subunit [Fibromonadales bacterium]